MATCKKHISKNGTVSYYIRTYDGYDSNGKQIERSMTWKPDPTMTEKQIQKELNRQAVMFEVWAAAASSWRPTWPAPSTRA